MYRTIAVCTRKCRCVCDSKRDGERKVALRVYAGGVAICRELMAAYRPHDVFSMTYTE